MVILVKTNEIKDEKLLFRNIGKLIKGINKDNKVKPSFTLIIAKQVRSDGKVSPTGGKLVGVDIIIVLIN